MFPYSQLSTLNFSGSRSFDAYALHRDVLPHNDVKEMCGFISLHVYLALEHCGALFHLLSTRGENHAQGLYHSFYLYVMLCLVAAQDWRSSSLRVTTYPDEHCHSQPSLFDSDNSPLSISPFPTTSMCSPHQANVLRLNTPLHQPTLWSSNLPIEDLSSCYAGASRENPPHWRRRVPPGQKSQSSFFVPADSEMLFKRYSRNDHSSLQCYETELKVLGCCARNCGDGLENVGRD